MGSGSVIVGRGFFFVCLLRVGTVLFASVCPGGDVSSRTALFETKGL